MALYHEHPLTLVDMNPKYPHDEVAYDDEEDLIIKQAFEHPCDMCDEDIMYIHRYYYNCDKCDYSIHKSCGELPKTLVHPSHVAHTLTLITRVMIYKNCCSCEKLFHYNQLVYHCSMCRLHMCLMCAMNAFQYRTIYHPSHQHPLTPISRNLLLNCDACGKDHYGVFYQCTTCFIPFIHKKCVFTPKRLLIQDSTLDHFLHIHPLILTYSFSKADQRARFYPQCKVCKRNFTHNEDLWVYRCDKCRYYVHLHCIHSRGKTYEPGAIDTPNVLRLPLTDETYNMIKDVVSKETNEMSITRNSHEHPLVLAMNDNEPAKCNACSIIIAEKTTFYKCTYDGCNFVLHDWCTRLPVELKDHKGHSQHTLLLLPKNNRLGELKCHVCYDVCDGFTYSCVECNYDIDVLCAFLPKTMIHKSHPHHFLSRVPPYGHHTCGICLTSSCYYIKGKTWLSCESCNFHLHLGCALLLPETIRHKYDKHPMTLTYGPVENHEGDYFCEVCEDELNPNACFYHCYECVQSMHIDCAPLIPPSKAYIGHTPTGPDPLDAWVNYNRVKSVEPYI